MNNSFFPSIFVKSPKQKSSKKINLFQHFKERPNVQALKRVLDSDEFKNERKPVEEPPKKKKKLRKINEKVIKSPPMIKPVFQEDIPRMGLRGLYRRQIQPIKSDRLKLFETTFLEPIPHVQATGSTPRAIFKHNAKNINQNNFRKVNTIENDQLAIRSFNNFVPEMFPQIPNQVNKSVILPPQKPDLIKVKNLQIKKPITQVFQHIVPHNLQDCESPLPKPTLMTSDSPVPVSPILTKSSLQIPKDISLVTRIIQNYREKPQYLLIIQFEGVIGGFAANLYKNKKCQDESSEKSDDQVVIHEFENNVKRKKKKKKAKKSEILVFEDCVPQSQTNQFLFLRPGIRKGLSKLKKNFYIVILIKRKSSVKRQKQIVTALSNQGCHFDAIYSHNSSDTQRYFSLDKILEETDYSPASTLILTSVDQISYDVNDYLEKDLSPPKIESKLSDFGLLPLPFTVQNWGDSFELDFHKLVVIAIPHFSQDLVSISFDHVTEAIRNMVELCPKQERDSEEDCPEYYIKPKYRWIYAPHQNLDLSDSSSDCSQIYQEKVFYKAFKKGMKYSLFSLSYQQEKANEGIKERVDKYMMAYKRKIVKIEGLKERMQKGENSEKREEAKRQPGYQGMVSYVKQYYKEIYEECLMSSSKIVGGESHPTMDQLTKLGIFYSNEIQAIQHLLNSNFDHSLNIMSLQGSLYTQKNIIQHQKASSLTFLTKLLPKNNIVENIDEEEIEMFLNNPEGRKILSFKPNQVPMEKVTNIVDWLSKKKPLSQIQYQQIS